jgi:ribosomal protein S18 acetylase RimI-like enzyme
VLIMVRRRPPDRGPDPGTAAEVSRDVGAATLAAFRREQPFGWQDEALRQLSEMDKRYDRVLAARDFASPPEDPACACRLYAHDGLGQVDEVGTLEARRRHGYARAAVAAAADAASADGCDAVFMVTDASDWPQELYRRLGFDEIGATYEFLKLPVSSRP